MRTKDMLKDFDAIRKLWTYLYADENRTIQVDNAIGAGLELRMREDGSVMARLVRPVLDGTLGDGAPESCYDEMLSIPVWLGIIEQLKERECTEFPGKFKNRWDEISFQAAIVDTLN